MKHQLPDKCACGTTDTLGAADVEVGGYRHTTDECTEITRTITIPKPEWCEEQHISNGERHAFKLGVEACSRASGITFNLE